MLAPLIVNSLIASLLLLAVGWVSDILHASTHNRRSYVCSEVSRSSSPRTDRTSRTTARSTATG